LCEPDRVCVWNGFQIVMKKLRVAVFFAVLAFSIVFPLLFPDPVITTIAIFTLIIMVAATGWNLFSGYTRYLSLGHATFYGFGAYILAIVCQVWNIQGGVIPLLLLPVIGLATGLCSLPLGWVALKTRRATFMVITIAIFALASLLPNLLNAINSQFSNIYLPNPPWSQSIFNIPFYYTALLLLFGALAIAWWMRSSKFGLCLLAIGDDEDRALGLGNNTTLYKLVAWTISSFFVGMAGALNAYYLGVLDPASAFERDINIALPVTAFLGGIGTLGGPLLGAIFTVPIQQYLTLQYGNVQGLDLILYGVLLLVVVLFMPQGLVPALQKRFLMGMPFFKKSSLASALEPGNFARMLAFVRPSAVSHEMMRENEARSQSLEPVEEFIPRSNSVPLSLRRGYSAMKAPRLVPLSQEMVTEGSANPSSGNGA
jgi:ABC-type branched-subunit amino acid transport system permease subunit